MAAHVAGINKWATAIRYRMANDPGRQDLDDHILCNGFLFLDEYLEDIFLGARSEPIIELTKTPGRRKDASKKDRVATAVGVTLGINIDEPPPPSPSLPLNRPVELSAIQESVIELTKTPVSRKDVSKDSVATIVGVTPGINIDEPASLSPSLLLNSAVESSANSESGLAATSHQVVANSGVELSIIAEGDENEMSRVSLPSSRPTGPIIHDKEISYHIPTDPNNPHGAMATVTVSYDPDADDDDDTQAFPATFDRSFNDSEPTSTASSFPIDPYARDYETHELPQMVPEHFVQPAEQHPPSHSPLAPSLTRKASVPVFPSLPAPSPLRKSTRDSFVPGPTTGNARPSAAAGNMAGTRSSWLNKARDVTAKRASVVSGIKRKSGDLTGETDYTMPDGYTRATKVAKMSAEDGVSDLLSDREKPQGRLAIQPFRAVIPMKPRELPRELPMAPVANPDGNSEGMMNILKRTVEGLGARAGKSMGKSLGGPAATAAAAEAKAAAEARLAQREAKGSDGNKQGRLSVSDLVGAYESSEASKNRERELLDTGAEPLPASPVPRVVSESRASISTTPPNTPPAVQHSESQVSPSPATTTYTIPKFKVQRHIQQEPSFALPESQPSTQSTYVSSIFDDHSAWPRHSLETDYTASQSQSQPKASYQNFEPALDHDHETSDLSKEVGWAQSQANLAIPPDEFTSPVAGHDPVSVDRLPGAFEPDDQNMELDVNDLRDDETESMAFKVGSSQDMATTSSQTGFIAQASTLLSKVMGSSVTSALGGSKRGKVEPVKSIQLAAAAAKKQQEEADRKAARLRDMDKRRAAIASKKADQETTDKSKQQGDRNKREREEAPERNVTKTTIKKAEEEVTKKRKVVVEIEKKPLGKKPLSKDKKDLGGSRIGKPILNTLSQSQLASGSMSKSFKQPGLPASASQPSVKLVGTSQGEPKPTATLAKAGSSQIKDKGANNGLEDVRQPSQAIHAQMQARVQAQMLQAKQEEPFIPSESIELPDINSEYSNSDDEDRPRTFDPPDWAQSPVLGLALQSQSRLNPDDIFGPVRPLRMEEIFTTRHSRFRARTSSANWAGTDELTTDEQKDYAKKMGYLD